jgi:UDP-N-acetylglucosamine 4,6-dehydratase
MNDTYPPRIICVTGGTGSFGNAVVQHMLKQAAVEEVRIVSRDENKQDAMRHEWPDPRMRYYIADVRERQSLQWAMAGADVVFHAAALKQVPSCEFFPEQAVLTNVLGSANVIEAAAQAGVQRVVFLSTDKAVQPVNAMGMTKALMEKLVQAHARRLGQAGPRLCCVRYGNVLYSRGSVVPLFIQRIREGRPLPVTDGRMTRFLLPLHDAVGMVELALSEGRQGDVLIRKSPAATVQTVAEAVSKMMHVPLRLEHIGVRHGEKLHEVLASTEEMAKAVDLGDHWRIPMDARSLDYAQQAAPGDAADYPPFTSDAARQLSVPEVTALLCSLPQVRAVLAAAGVSGHAAGTGD